MLDGGVKVELAPLNELQHGGGGHRLGYRGGAVECVRSGRHEILQISKSETVGVDDAVVDGNGDGKRGYALSRHLGGDHGLDSLNLLGRQLGRSLGGQRQRQRHHEDSNGNHVHRHPAHGYPPVLKRRESDRPPS